MILIVSLPVAVYVAVVALDLNPQPCHEDKQTEGSGQKGSTQEHFGKDAHLASAYDSWQTTPSAFSSSEPSGTSVVAAAAMQFFKT